ncbi:hypothetical protein FDZ84_23110 [Saccharopolyspora sp. ASAGF58]|nr:hypothetical protein FDZ84_23110 [Saccharopolyspora sp. ASAGF58]
MNVPLLDDIHDAARLVAFACQPRMRPLADKTYDDLLERYRSSTEFRDLTDNVADGLGLDVIAAHPQEGLIVHPLPGGMFSFRLADYHKLRPEQRMMMGLIHIAIAARAYPTPADLEEESIKRVSVSDVDGFLRHLIGELKREAEDSDGLIATNAEFDRAWHAYDRMVSVKPSRRGNGWAMSCTYYWITHVLDWLVGQGMAQRAPEFGAGHYRLLHRFRLQVAEVAGPAVFDKIADIRRRQVADDPPCLPSGVNE